jgi:hypothetical protein
MTHIYKSGCFEVMNESVRKNFLYGSSKLQKYYAKECHRSGTDFMYLSLGAELFPVAHKNLAAVRRNFITMLLTSF